MKRARECVAAIELNFLERIGNIYAPNVREEKIFRDESNDEKRTRTRVREIGRERIRGRATSGRDENSTPCGLIQRRDKGSRVNK